MRWLGQLELTDCVNLGKGAFGEVYAAKLVAADGVSQDVVLKLPRGEDMALSIRYLLQEARLIAGFKHPNIIGYRDYNVVERDGERVPCLIMEHGGVPLSTLLLSHGGRLDPGIATFIAVGVLSGLAYSHSRGVIHRDVKPQNVVIGSDGQVRLIDYGLARAADPRNPSTVAKNVKGTPTYISPEHYRGRKLDGRADVWAVGVMLFEMLTGRPPWEVDDSEPNELVRLRAISDLVMTGPLPLLPKELVPGDLAEVITRMLMKEPADRYDDALQAMYALERVARGLVGPWAAARELGQQALAAVDPRARRRRPALDEVTANVRGDVRSGMLVRASDDCVSVIVPPEILEDAFSEENPFRESVATSEGEGPDVTTRIVLPILPRSRSNLVKYGLVAASMAVAASAAVFWSGPKSTAKGSAVAWVAKPPSSAVAAIHPASAGVSRKPAGDSTRPIAAIAMADDTPMKKVVAPPLEAPAVLAVLPPSPPAAAKRSKDSGEMPVKSDRKAPGRLEVVLIPRGSLVSLDGNTPVTAPVTFHGVSSGVHLLRVGLKGDSLGPPERIRIKSGEVRRFERELANPFGD